MLFKPSCIGSGEQVAHISFISQEVHICAYAYALLDYQLHDCTIYNERHPSPCITSFYSYVSYISILHILCKRTHTHAHTSRSLGHKFFSFKGKALSRRPWSLRPSKPASTPTPLTSSPLPTHSTMRPSSESTFRGVSPPITSVCS